MRRRGRDGWRAWLPPAQRPGGAAPVAAAAGGLLVVALAVALLRAGPGPGVTGAAPGPPVGGYRVSHWAGLLADASARTGLDPDLLEAVVLCESSGDPRAVSPVGAKGLMQIMPLTHVDAQRRFGLPAGDLFDPAHNVDVGSRYLAYLLDRFGGDRRLAVAAYHMGPTRVARLRRQDPNLSSEQLVAAHAGPATRAYVERVLREAG